MARTKIDILTPVPHGRDFNTSEAFIPSTLLVVYNGNILNSPMDFTEYGSNNGFRLNFKLPGTTSTTTDNLFAIYQILDRSGIVLQETLRKVNEETRFQFMTSPGLTDVKITIYNNSGNTKVVDNVSMLEKENTGVYEYNFIPTSVGVYTAIMKDTSDNNMQVTEIIALEANLDDIFQLVTDIHNKQVLGKPKIILGDC